MLSPIQLTSHQQEAFDAIKAFIQGPGDCFILEGGAGTGKTTLMAALAGWLKGQSRPDAFLAPTGRAARILGDKTGVDATTIHGCIYAFERLNVFEEAETKNDPGLRFRFSLRRDDPGATVFVIDEASMVGDVQDKQDVLRFGSGRLLADLVEYSRLNRPGRVASDPGAKLVFVGDPAQLPPVGQRLSPALSADYLAKEFGFCCIGFELTEVHRQAAGSVILERASAIRKSIEAKRFNTFDLDPSGEALLAEQIPESVGRVVEGYRQGGGASVLITYTNAKALELNRSVRGRLWGDELADVRAGDQLLVNHNSHRCGLYNGDLVRVLDVAAGPERWTVYMRGVEPVDLSFRQATVAYKSGNGEVRKIDCLLLENLLHSKERALSPVEQRALLVDFRKRYPRLKPGTSEFGAALRVDPWFNALQVKYGYAMTCHKAQGGEWDTAVVNFESGRGAHNEDFFRWAYTAITRAKRTVVTISAPSFDVYTGMDWGSITEQADPADHAGTALNDTQTDPDWDRYSFSPDQAGIFGHHCKIRDALCNRGITVDALDHLQYCERYRLRRDKEIASVQYWYKGDGKVSRVGPAAGARSGDAALVEAALDAMREALLGLDSGGEEIEDPFLRAFAQKVEQAIADTGIRILSKASLPYRLRIGFTDGGRRGEIDFCYDGTPKWTKVQEVGGPGKTQGLIDRVRSLLEGE
ncbi:MAG: AAA family ATPase [Thiohalocapsa sp.]|nr:AAA family ATPase [Thiohalocapsa sp.]MCF7990907.1 AAA family ATPase [Thiohalocapsa sp.]